jgi:putative membrane protein
MDRAATVISALAVLVVGAIVLSQVETGPLSLQMVQHLAAMNVVAPLVAAFFSFRPADQARRSFLWSAALAQIVLLWAWHVPAVQQAAAASMVAHLIMLGSLTVAALAFWAAILASAATARWGAIAALLLTGKLACLLGALLIFAPRELYRLAELEFVPGSASVSVLGDQQLAGLLMITACPLSYLVAGVVLAAQAMADLERAGPQRARTPREAG